MIAGHRDLPQVLFDRFRISQILFRDRCKTDNRIHRRTDIMRHRREKVGLCLICRCRFFSCRLQSSVEIKHDCQVKNKEDQKTGRYKTYQHPVFGIDLQIIHRHKTQKCPSFCFGKRSIGKYAFFAARVVHDDRTGRRSDRFE